MFFVEGGLATENYMNKIVDYEIVPLKAVMAAMTMYRQLKKRKNGVPQMALVHGVPGTSKTSALAYLAESTQGLYIRALCTDTPVVLLSRLVRLCNVVPNSTRGLGPMVEAIAEYLRDNDLPLFVDEVDFLLGNNKLIESIRDIHDLSNQPVVLCGSHKVENKLHDKPQLFSRISQWLQVPPCDIEDAAVLAEALCEVKIKRDLLEDMHHHCKGNARLMAVALGRIEAVAKSSNAESFNLEWWGVKRKYFVNQLARGA